MANLDSNRFEIDSTLDLAADGYRADLNSPDAFHDASSADTVKLTAGFKDADENSFRVGCLDGGIDEYVLTQTKDQVSVSIQGRDNLSKMLDRNYTRLFLRQEPIPPPAIPYEVGLFRASEIAARVAAEVGLSLAWLCRDYTMLEDFSATGRPVDILKKLVEPWSQVPALAVDIFNQGDAVIVRERQLVMAADPMATYTVKDARIKTLKYRKRRGPLFGTVTLLGKLESKQAISGIVPGQQPTDPPGPVRPWEVEDTRVHDTKDERGQVTASTQVTTVYRMPDKLVLSITERTFTRTSSGAMDKTAEKITANEWEASIYNETGPANRPRQLRETLNVRGIHQSDKSKTFRDLSQQITEFAYDGAGFQSMTFTRKWEINLKTKKLEESERLEKILSDTEDLKVRQATTIFKPTKLGKWYVKDVDTQTSAGYRPAGFRPPKPEKEGTGITSSADTAKEAIKLERTLSTDPLAQDVSYSNANLTAEDLACIMAKFEAVSGLWEHEITLEYLAMPWLRKGHVLSLTGLVDSAGRSVPLAPALVTDLSLTYDEAKSREMVSTLTARYWA